MSLGRTIFLPPREVLTLFPGFASAYMRRELEFDRTSYDLCIALDAKPLRGPRPTVRADLLAPIEQALGGHVVVENGRFYLDLPDGRMEAPLVAEGLRKLAMLAHLIANGSLTANAFLFWDEPEANLSPKLSQLTSDVVFRLAGADEGVQVFLATHDYVLTSDLSLATETNAAWRPGTVFFALGASWSRIPSSWVCLASRSRTWPGQGNTERARSGPFAPLLTRGPDRLRFLHVG